MSVLEKALAAALVAVLLPTAAASSGTGGPVSGSGEAQLGAQPDDLTAYVAERQRATSTPGLAWAVVSPEGTVASGVRGVDGDGDRVTHRTPFVWGSVSKPVTASLVVRLAGRGLLDLDDRAVEHLPDLRTARGASGRITLRHLLSHTSGLPEGLGLLDDPRPGREPADVVDDLAGVELVGTPGERHVYSGLGYVVLAAVVEEVTGEPFAEALGAAGLPGAASAGGEALDVPPGHRYVAGRPVPFEVRPDDAALAAGYLSGSLDELAGFARTQLPGARGATDPERSLLHSPEVGTGQERSAYGLGWRISPMPGAPRTMLWHGGAAPGYAAAVALLPDGAGEPRAVVVLQNVYGPFADEALVATAGGLAAMVAGDDPTPVEVGSDGAWLLAGLLLIGLGGLAVGAWLVRRRRPGRVAPAVAILVAVGVASALWLLPGLLGVRLRQTVLWAPDVAWLLHADLAVCGLLVVVGASLLCRGRATMATTDSS